MSASKDLLRGFAAISQTKGKPTIVISTKAVYGCVGNDPSGDPVGHSPKAKMRWSPDARGARDGDPVRGACAFPYRNKQCEVLRLRRDLTRLQPEKALTSYLLPPACPWCHSDQTLVRGGIPCYDEVAFNQRNRTHLGAISSTIIHFSFFIFHS